LWNITDIAYFLDSNTQHAWEVDLLYRLHLFACYVYDITFHKSGSDQHHYLTIPRSFSASMGKGNARRRAAAQKTRELLTKGNESVLLSELEGFAEAIAGAYDGLRQYQEGQVPGQKGVILDYDVSRI
jgi:hypothetical protein